MGRHVLRRHIWGYTVCLCPTKGMPGLNELNAPEYKLIGNCAAVLTFNKALNLLKVNSTIHQISEPKY